MDINTVQGQHSSDCNDVFDENDLLKCLTDFMAGMDQGDSQWNMPDTPDSLSDQQIKDANLKAEEIINSAKIAVIKSYVSHEETRIKNRKPLLIIIAILTLIQILVFNALVCLIIILSFKNTNVEILLQLFELLKYYIGATVVELLGMLTFITTATFSLNHLKVMQLIFEENKKTTD